MKTSSYQRAAQKPGQASHKVQLKVNSEVLIGMLGDKAAPYDDMDVLEKIEKLIMLIETERTLSPEEKQSKVYDLCEDLNRRAKYLVSVMDLTAVSSQLSKATLILNRCEKWEVERSFYGLLSYTYMIYSLYFRRINDDGNSMILIKKARAIAKDYDVHTYLGSILLNLSAFQIQANMPEKGIETGEQAVIQLYKDTMKTENLANERVNQRRIDSVTSALSVQRACNL